MLTALELENFKGVSDRQRIEFAPVTLLFGANSAGKSSMLHALVYLHELIVRGDPNVDQTGLGGGVLELGGFARLIHRHETNRTMLIRAEFDTPGDINRSHRDLTSFPFSDLEDEVERAWIEIRVQQLIAARGVRRPVISETRVGIGSERSAPLVWLTRSPDFLFARVNLTHPSLPSDAVGAASAWHRESVDERIDPTLSAQGGPAGFSAEEGWGIGDPMAIPVFALSPSPDFWAFPSPTAPIRLVAQYDESTPEDRVEAASQIETFLDMVVLGTTTQLVGFLERSLYLGPLRSVPPPGSLIERSGRASCWADGLAAWDTLLADRGGLVEKTNEWLGRLEAGCTIEVQQLVAARTTAEEISTDHVDSTIRRLLLNPVAQEPGATEPRTYVLPSEVGAGISQVVPVIVAALAERRIPLVMIEQPELHVHPALQTGLGDLFISAAGSRQLIIETHSEHLILRLLRRIRETTEGRLPPEASPFASVKLSVLYLQNTRSGIRVRRLGVDERGEFTDKWPKGFFDERFLEIYGT